MTGNHDGHVDNNKHHEVTHAFDKDYWERNWQPGAEGGPGSMGLIPANPYLASELSGLTPGTALDAGCGAGAEAIWLAAAGWKVTAADISSVALALAADRAVTSGTTEGIEWVEADLSTWKPETRFDLVTTHYAHPAIPQLDFYGRIAEWVAPGGTLLIVGHLLTAGRGHGPGHGHGAHGGHNHPPEASATPADVTARLDSDAWEIAVAEERHRSFATGDGQVISLDDFVVRATRRR